MFRTYCIYIVIPVFNQVSLMDRTMESILTQTYPQSELRVLFVDNCSSDGSYEKALEYVKAYPQLVSVYRMPQPTKPARLLKQASRYLRFSLVQFIMYLNPGDELYPEFMSSAIRLMHLRGNISAVYANVDLRSGNGETRSQIPVFTENCVINKETDYALFFTAGIGAKVQAIYKGRQILATERLIDVEKRTDIHDWLGAAFSNCGDVAYLTESMGCVQQPEQQDVMFALMTKAYSLKSQFYMTETNANYVEQYKRDTSDMEAAYRCLAKNALLCAIEEGKQGDRETAEKCMMFAEMMCLEIVEEDAWFCLQDALCGKASYDIVEELLRVDSVVPPKHCFIF